MTENAGGTPRDPQRDPETPPTQPVPESFGAEPAPADPGRSETFEQGATQPYGQAGADAPYGQAGTPYEQQGGAAGYGAGYGQPASPAVTQYGYAATPPKNDLAVWSLVTGILSYVTCPLLLGIAAIVTGTMGRRAADDGLANNRGMATAGLILGWINVALAILGVVFFIFVLGAGLLSGGISQWSYMND
jgi:hypothetical protein